MVAGALAWIRRYPVKSLRGEYLATAEIAVEGIPGDRQSRLVVQSGHVRAGRAYRGKEDERLHLLDDPVTAQEAAAERGVGLSVERNGHFFDDAPLSLVFDRWLDELSARVGYALEAERFRPNLFVRASSEFSKSELEIVDDIVEIGSVTLRIVRTISRCVVITYDLAGAPSDPAVLREVAQRPGAIFGVYCDVLRTGTVRNGDSVRLVER